MRTWSNKERNKLTFLLLMKLLQRMIFIKQILKTLALPNKTKFRKLACFFKHKSEHCLSSSKFPKKAVLTSWFCSPPHHYPFPTVAKCRQGKARKSEMGDNLLKCPTCGANERPKLPTVVQNRNLRSGPRPNLPLLLLHLPRSSAHPVCLHIRASENPRHPFFYTFD